MNQRGFSIIELLIVLGLTGIFLTVGVLNTVGYFMRQSLDVETKSIVALLRDAQSRSMGQEDESRWGVSFYNQASDSKDTYTLFKVDEVLFASSSFVGLPGEAIEQKTMKQNLGFTSPLEGIIENVVFNKITGSPNAATTITIRLNNDASAERTVEVNSNGKIDYQ